MREGERAGGKVISEGEGEREEGGEGGAGDVGRRSYFADMAGGFGVSESVQVVWWKPVVVRTCPKGVRTAAEMPPFRVPLWLSLMFYVKSWTLIVAYQ
jgi:hypothetical protein